MISQAVTILCFWIFLYRTEAMKIKSARRSLCDIQTPLWLFPVLILLINPHFEISIWPPPLLPRQSKQHVREMSLLSSLYIPHSPSPTQTSPSHHTNFSLYFPHPVPILLLSDSWSPQCHLHNLMTKSYKTLKETQDTSKINALPEDSCFDCTSEYLISIKWQELDRAELSLGQQ